MFVKFKLGRRQIGIADYLRSIGEEDPNRTIEKTGPTKVWHLDTKETTLSLAIDTARDLLAQNPELQGKIKNLYCVTETPNKQFPGNSFDIASALELTTSTRLIDLNSGCTGFVDALSLAAQSGSPALIVCSEAYSINSDASQKSIRCLFSDAAAAVYFDPKEYEVLVDESIFVPNTSNVISKEVSGKMNMTGPAVFTFGLSDVTSLFQSVFQKCPDINLCFMHQGSKLMVDELTKVFAETTVIVPTNIRERGNTVSATLPILYADHCENLGSLSEQKMLFVGFGVGLYAHAMVMKRNG